MGHARQYYPFVSSEPPIFFLFEEGVLPNGYQLVQSVSPTGDDCHHEIQGISNNRLGNFFKAHAWSQFLICENGNYRQLTQADVDRFSLPGAP